ncbi:class I SAM-dependent methyltransferase [Garicola koreensis]|uniref:SAM-dependent methyltransferase n=1 Tax=Garicola koreensis TaxID=1262554 RepID=A0A7W5XKF6_9MICC|nr:class I SAM-dependent methyltransferase [Garicola koreensis]MBB3667532.1 SAM-dependent methyltransferase [Garicola koreensis]
MRTDLRRESAVTGSGVPGVGASESAATRAGPNRPKARTDAAPLITAEQRRRRLGGAFARQQSLTEAEAYDAVRPHYPHQAVAQILALAGSRSKWALSAGISETGRFIPARNAHSGVPEVGREAEPSIPTQIQQSISGGAPRVVDLGAGTGILSRQLLAAGASVHAVEPSAAMTEVLAQSEVLARAAGGMDGRLQISHAQAEDTGLPSGETDIVVAAQAWHWFDPQAVQAEVRRLLAPGGGLGLIWNYLDTADPTVHRLTRIMRAGDVYRPGWRPTLDTECFTQPQTVEHRWSRTLSVAEILRYATTLSSWLAAEDDARARRRANLQDYLHRELGLTAADTVELPQITVLHTARLRHAAPGDQDLQR